MTSHSDATGQHVETRVVLRPLTSPLPLGFVALAVATTGFAALQLSWVPEAQGSTVALCVLAFTVPLQFLAAVMGFLARDPAAATGMGVLAGSWAAACLATLTSPPGASSEGLGVVLLASSGCLLVPVVAARRKLVPALVMLTSSLRFAATGIAEIDGGRGWMLTAGWIGIALAVVSGYAALALELEGSESRTVIPLGRLGASRRAVAGDAADDAGRLAGEPGVRPQL